METEKIKMGDTINLSDIWSLGTYLTSLIILIIGPTIYYTVRVDL